MKISLEPKKKSFHIEKGSVVFFKCHDTSYTTQVVKDPDNNLRLLNLVEMELMMFVFQNTRDIAEFEPFIISEVIHPNHLELRRI